MNVRMVLLALLLAAGCASTGTDRDLPHGPAGRVEIVSPVFNAKVYLNGKFIGYSPVPPVALPSGDHFVVLYLEGYRPTRSNFKVEEGKTTHVAARLDPAGPPRF